MYVWSKWTWRWCLVTLKTVDKVMLTIFGDDKFSQPPSFTPKGRAYDFGSKFQISSKIVYSQIEIGNDVWWCFRVKSKWFFPYMKMWNFSSRHLGFFPKGLGYYFGSKFQISLNFLYGQMWPKNDVCWCFRVKSKSFRQNMKISNFISRHLGFFSKGLAFDFGSKFQISFKFVNGQIDPGNNV